MSLVLTWGFLVHLPTQVTLRYVIAVAGLVGFLGTTLKA